MELKLNRNRNKKLVTIAMYFGMLYFVQLYAKLGYVVTNIVFKDYYLAIASAAILGAFAGIANASLILTNNAENDSTNKELMLFDMFISMFFYSEILVEVWQSDSWENVSVAVAAILLAVYSSRLLFGLSERVRANNVEEDNSVLEASDLHRKATNLLQSIGIQLPTGSESVADILDLVGKAYQERLKDNNLVASEAESLRPLTNEVAMLKKLVEATNQEKEQAYQAAQEKAQSLEEAIQNNLSLQEQLEALKQEISQIRNNREIGNTKGIIKKLMAQGKEDEALAKQKEIFEKYGVELPIKEIELQTA